MSYLKKNYPKINEILEERNKDWPKRKKAWYSFNSEIPKFYKYLLENRSLSIDYLDINSLNEIEKFENNPVFICGNMKSGTSLLAQLLDGHEKTFVLPGDSHYINEFYNIKNINIDKIGETWLKRMINPTGQEPYWVYGKAEEMYQNFINHLHFFIQKKKGIFKSIVLSLIASTKHIEIKNYKYWIEKTPLNELHTSKLLKEYPKAKFINIVRDPIQNIVSLKRLDKYRNRKSNTFQKILFQRYLMEQTFKNEENINNYKIIYYDDLISNTKKQMESICDFLDIKFTENLLIPSINHLHASANSMYKNQRTKGKVNNSNRQNNILKHLSKFEKIMIANLLSNLIELDEKLYANTKKLLKYQNVFYSFFAQIIYFSYKIYRQCLQK